MLPTNGEDAKVDMLIRPAKKVSVKRKSRISKDFLFSVILTSPYNLLKTAGILKMALNRTSA